MPAYIYGYKVAKMCKILEGVRCHSKGTLKGAGKIIYDKENKRLIGEEPKITQQSYFEYDTARYTKMLDDFKKGWHYYLSVLETDLIEEKLTMILNSLTFRYSR